MRGCFVSDTHRMHSFHILFPIHDGEQHLRKSIKKKKKKKKKWARWVTTLIVCFYCPRVTALKPLRTTQMLKLFIIYLTPALLLTVTGQNRGREKNQLDHSS